jgi:protein-tyrosine-phosphatase
MVDPFNALFLCRQNSARSIIAETLLRDLAAERFRAHSAGSDPLGSVHPMALAVLEERGHSLAGLRSKHWDEFLAPDAPTMDFVFNLCHREGGESCPVWPGRPITSEWHLENPAASDDPDEQRLLFRRTYMALKRWIEILAELPVESLNSASLRERLAKIPKG